MAVLGLRFYGDPVLREKAEPIGEITDELRGVAEDMIETMHEHRGIGLAANQVGRLDRILVIDVTDAEERKAKGKDGKRAPAEEKTGEVFINPEIVESSIEDESYPEGCLSIPEVEADVYRPSTITLRWTDLEGERHEETIDGLRGRVLQHEIDHLNGVLFVDHLGMLKRKMLAGKLNRLKRKTLEELGTEEGK